MADAPRRGVVGRDVCRRLYVVRALGDGQRLRGDVEPRAERRVHPLAVVEAISQGAAQSWQMDHRHRTMAERSFDHGFAVEWMRKDLGLALAEARRNGAQLPLAALVDQFYADVEAMGGRRWDTSSLIARLKRGPAA